MAMTKEERLRALERQRKAAGRGASTGSSKGKVRTKSGNTATNRLAAARTSVSEEGRSSSFARTPEELRQKRRKEEWERKVREARAKRMAMMLGILAVIAIVIIVIVGKANDDPKVFHESPKETEEQTIEQTPEETPEETEEQTPEETPEQTPAETPEETRENNLAGIGMNQPQDLVAIQSRIPSYVQQQFLTPNEFSRPQFALSEINYIVIHYVGNPNTSAQANWDYFEGLKIQTGNEAKVKKASSNFIVGLQGEVLQCIPVNEIAYCSNHQNWDSLSIEVCHPDAAGQFNSATYNSVVELTAWLCKELGLTEADVIRHYDVTGKQCPVYYVKNPAAWEQLKADVGYRLRNMN